MRFAVAVLVVALTALSAFAQAPTLRIVTDDPNLPSDLFYGNVKVKPLRVRPGTAQLITIDDADFYVQTHYIDFLSRMPDPSGFAFWVNQITSCGADAGCIDNKRSIEFQQSGYLVERIYKAAYGVGTGTSTLGGAHSLEVPIVRLSELFPDTKAIGQGVVVGQSGWEAVLEANKVAFTNAFVQRTRFTDAFPATMTPAQFVDKLNANAGNPLSQTDRDALVNSASTRGQILRAVAENANLYNAEFNRAFVFMQYQGYLRRDPNTGQDTDYTGFDFWLTKLNNAPGNHDQAYINAEMVRSFIVSQEYRGRF